MNHQDIGDVVLFKDENQPSNSSCFGCVVEAYKGDDDLVRKVKLNKAIICKFEKKRETNFIMFIFRTSSAQVNSFTRDLGNHCQGALIVANL